MLKCTYSAICVYVAYIIANILICKYTNNSIIGEKKVVGPEEKVLGAERMGDRYAYFRLNCTDFSPLAVRM